MAQRARSGYGLRANPHPSLQRRAEANRSQFYAKCVEKFEQLASDGRLLHKARRGEKPPHPSLQRRAEANRSQFYAKCVEKFEQLASDGRLLHKARRGEKPYLEGIFYSIIHYYNNTEANNTIVFFQILNLVIIFNHCSRS